MTEDKTLDEWIGAALRDARALENIRRSAQSRAVTTFLIETNAKDVWVGPPHDEHEHRRKEWVEKFQKHFSERGNTPLKYFQTDEGYAQLSMAAMDLYSSVRDEVMDEHRTHALFGIWSRWTRSGAETSQGLRKMAREIRAHVPLWGDVTYLPSTVSEIGSQELIILNHLKSRLVGYTEAAVIGGRHEAGKSEVHFQAVYQRSYLESKILRNVLACHFACATLGIPVPQDIAEHYVTVRGTVDLQSGEVWVDTPRRGL